MNTSVALTIGLVIGVVAGVLFEHQRFLKEIQGLSKQHASPDAPNTAPPANGEDTSFGAHEVQTP